MRHLYNMAVCLNPTFQKTIVLEHLWENEVNRSSNYYFDAAGKGANTARVLNQLGCSCTHLTHLGGERLAEMLSLMERDHIHVQWADSQSPIRTCTTLINMEKATTTEIVEESEPVAPGTEEKIKNLFLEILPHIGTVIISGTKAQGYSDELYPFMVEVAKADGRKVILDIKGSDLLNSLQFHPEIIKPNFKEFVGTFFPGEEVKEHDPSQDLIEKVKEKMIELNNKYQVSTVLTRGSHPTLFFQDGKIYESPIQRIVPLNTIGSGDAVTAGMASILNKGGSIAGAVQKGQECGAMNALLLRPGVIC